MTIKKLLFTLLLITLQLYGCHAKELKIDENPIPNLKREYFQDRKNLHEIRQLDLTNCGIKTIDKDAFNDFPALKILLLQNNSINNVNFHINELKILSLDKNLLKRTPSLSKFPKLLNLNLVDNTIRNVYYETKEHPLENLNLSNNLLEEVRITSDKIRNLTITTPKTSFIMVDINCPELSNLQTYNVVISDDDLDKICENSQNATIFMDTKPNRLCSTDELKIVEEKLSTIIISLLVIMSTLVLILFVTIVVLYYKLRKSKQSNSSYNEYLSPSK